MKIKITLLTLLSSMGFYFISCSKIGKIEKKIDGIDVIVTLDPTDSGEFVYQTVQTNKIREEIEKAGFKVDNVKSIDAVLDSVVILNPSTPVLNFGNFHSIKFSAKAEGTEERVLFEQKTFDDPEATVFIPATKNKIDWAELLKTNGDMTFTARGSLRIKTPLKKDMKYCVSFYVSLSE